jgi:hypothetical protein
MSMSRTVLKLVQKSLPQLRLCQDKLVLPPTGHVVRGFMFERTPYKGTFYLWSWVSPLFRVTLDYSTRIPKGEDVQLSKERPEESAAMIMAIVSANLGCLESMRTPRDFLDHISWMIGNDTPNFLFDLAVTYFLLGRHDEALLTLRETSEAAERTAAGFVQAGYPNSRVIPKMNELRGTAEHFARAVRSNPPAAAEIVRNWERKNIEKFDLAATVAEPTQS